MTETWRQWEGRVIKGETCDFHLRQYLGSSERSAVFLTERGPELQKAAIKLVAADPGDAETQLSRWQSIVKLSHPHLLRLFEAGRCRIESAEILFAVMEYAEEDLSQILPERPLTLAETQDMLRPTLEALAYLHGQGFVHGHLKPANIMAVHDQLKLASDGLYAAGGRVATHKRGSHDAPEIHASTESAHGGVSPAADVWSLGMTLVEVLTQHLPAWNEKGEAGPVVPQNLPEPFLDIVRNCLPRNPQHRWTIAEVAARLDPSLPAAPDPGPIERESVKQKKASAKWRILVPAAIASFAGALLAGSGFLHRQHAAQPQPQTQLREDAPVTKPEPKPDTPETQNTSSATSLEDPTPKYHEPPNATNHSPLLSPASPSEISTTPGGRMLDGIVHQELPQVTQKARDTIQGKIKVKIRVHVDAPGNVVEAELDSPGPSRYFAQLALQAARRWKFTPAPADPHDAAREWLLRFEFGSAQTRVFPSPMAR